uniref:BPTI/Kunitz inhibitor domain-containing protein n=1 Tax=Ditylenchus dipsaci TaxID=166011 RepID=A0A915EDC8_9BILA
MYEDFSKLSEKEKFIKEKEMLKHVKMRIEGVERIIEHKEDWQLESCILENEKILFLILIKSSRVSCEKSIICSLQKVHGPCDNYQLRYYFNVEEDACKFFFYSGCNGNANNFQSLAECQTTCIGQTSHTFLITTTSASTAATTTYPTTTTTATATTTTTQPSTTLTEKTQTASRCPENQTYECDHCGERYCETSRQLISRTECTRSRVCQCICKPGFLRRNRHLGDCVPFTRCHTRDTIEWQK